VNPSHCQLWTEFRIPSNITTDLLLETVNDYITAFTAPGTTIEMKVIDRVEPYTADQKTSLVKAFTRSLYQQTGSRVTLVKKSGTGDMNYYGAATDTPCITYGPGDPHLDHTDEEHIKVEDYFRGIEIIRQSLLILNTLH
ncbi:MAG: M20/M25/M40 family metallo-hydrolase, partial [Candidatus Bathyarchaeota archaeon]